MYVYFLCGPKQVMEKGRGKDNDRIAVPELVIEIYLKMLLDLARDGAGYRSDDPSSKAFNSMYAIDNPAMKIAAMHHSMNL
jgi:hypothetical protein